MILKAIIRMQCCVTYEHWVFVPRGQAWHSVARGRIQYFQATASSWAGIRLLLRGFGASGYTHVTAESAEIWGRDIVWQPPSLIPLSDRDAQSRIQDMRRLPELYSGVLGAPAYRVGRKEPQ
jgi:hypothetical protein